MGTSQLLTAKNEAGPSTNGALIVSQANQVLKIELMPNGVKLNGVNNYLNRSRQIMLILKTKGVMEYVLGLVDKSADKESSKWNKWSVTDSLILTWLLNSMAPAIAASAKALLSASTVWSLLSTRYSGKGNVMLMSQIEDKIYVVRQGDRS
jgi:hypothetical protein